LSVSDDTGELVDDHADDANRAAAPTAVAVLHHIVSSIVDDPAAVRVDASDDGRRIRLDVRVGPGDLGRVIGRRGRTAQSIRTVVRAAAARDDAEVDVEFVDD
jgi:predicted RNA-binding protein YlqC (UPF0109 family)